VARGSISRREDFTGNDESGSIGTEVLKEIAEAVEGEEATCGNLMKAEPNDGEQNREHKESKKLYRLSPNRIDGSNSHPVPRNQTCD
jgi:hypothetical protein